MFGSKYEHRSMPLAGEFKFFFRLARSAALAALIVFLGLAVGVLGYHYLGELDWIDALVDASMLLGGMGPVNPMKTTAGKLFASFYALFSGIIFLTMASILFAPVYHRLLHHFHLESEDNES